MRILLGCVYGNGCVGVGVWVWVGVCWCGGVGCVGVGGVCSVMLEQTNKSFPECRHIICDCQNSTGTQKTDLEPKSSFSAKAK